jgi:hypothetical protein
VIGEPGRCKTCLQPGARLVVTGTLSNVTIGPFCDLLCCRLEYLLMIGRRTRLKGLK